MIKCFNSKLFLCIFMDGLHEGRVWELDCGDRDGLCRTGSLGLLKKGVDLPWDSCPSILLDRRIAHCEISISNCNGVSRWKSGDEGELGKS